LKAHHDHSWTVNVFGSKPQQTDPVSERRLSSSAQSGHSTRRRPSR
jgi:hypothetical protein